VIGFQLLTVSMVQKMSNEATWNDYGEGGQCPNCSALVRSHYAKGDCYFPQASHQVLLLSTDTEIGKTEVKRLRENGAIAREYLLRYDSALQQTKVKSGYFC
jgi:hypothetical protein